MSRYRTLLPLRYRFNYNTTIFWNDLTESRKNLKISRFYTYSFLLTRWSNSISQEQRIHSSRKKETDIRLQRTKKGIEQRDDPSSNTNPLGFPLYSLYSLGQRRGVQRNTDKFHEFIIIEERANRIPHRVVISAGNTADIIPTIISSPWPRLLETFFLSRSRWRFTFLRKQRERERGGDSSVFRNPRLDVARKREGSLVQRGGSGDGRKEKARLGTNDSFKRRSDLTLIDFRVPAVN